MSDMSGPPFRADHVGSLLRPPELLRTRASGRARTPVNDFDDDIPF
jgi:methionine synthase II (cobalamin-independent)